MIYLEAVLRIFIALAVLIVGVWILSGVIALSLFVVLPVILILIAVGTFYVWNSFHVGEIGTALDFLEPEQIGPVLFRRGFGADGRSFAFTMRMRCRSVDTVAPGDTVVIVEAKFGHIVVKKLEG